MSDPVHAEQSHSQPENQKKSRLFLLISIILVAWFILQDPQRFWNILMVLMGFGAVIFVHELGHFAAAKSVGILVEAFSIGFGPVVAGIKRIRGGFQVRVLPSLLPGKNGIGSLGFVIPSGAAKEGDTEYRISLIPLGGFVKMLGQEDLAADKPSEDPRSFTNKKVWQRMIVIAAGVIMNILVAAAAFIFVFARGVELMPAVVGGVLRNSPAEQAGLKAGDEILGVDGKKNENLTFMELTIACAFAEPNRPLSLEVRRTDGSLDTVQIQPQMDETLGIMQAGIIKPMTCTIAPIAEEAERDKLEALGFRAGDRITAINDTPIQQAEEIYKTLYLQPGLSNPREFRFTIERPEPDTSKTLNLTIPAAFTPFGADQKTWNILGMIPRLRVKEVNPDSSAEKAGLQKNDILIRIGTISNPSILELRSYFAEFANQPVELVVLREENQSLVEKTLSVTPQYPKQSLWESFLNRLKAWINKKSYSPPDPIIGFMFGFDVSHLIVAESAAMNDAAALPALPRGCLITHVADVPVGTWGELTDQLQKFQGKSASLTYQPLPGQPAATHSVTVPDHLDWIGFSWQIDLGGLTDLPLNVLERTYQGKNWRENLRLGMHNTEIFLTQTYLMIKGMLTGSVAAKAASGPVGILKISYTVASEKSWTYYVYFLAMISVCIAVFNFLPLPILDGGHFVLLLIEKIKGSPISIRMQEIITYAGLVLIGSLFLYVTFNDFLNLISGKI